jgi:hypothetical protein
MRRPDHPYDGRWDFTTAPLWQPAKPRRPWLIPLCAAAFIAVLSALVVAHACWAVT